MIDTKPDSGYFFVELFNEVFAWVRFLVIIFWLVFALPDISEKLVMINVIVEAFRLDFFFVLLNELYTIELLFKQAVLFIELIKLRQEFLLQKFKFFKITIILILIIFGLK